MRENNTLNKKILVVCTTDSMIWNFLIPHIEFWQYKGLKITCVCSKTGFYFEELQAKHGLSLIEIPFSRSPYKLKNIKCLVQLRNIISSQNFDLIICQEPVGGLMGRLAGIGKSAKVIYTAHGFHFYKNAPLLNWLIYYPVEKILSYFTDILITTNNEDYHRSLKFHAKQTVKLDGVGINLSKFTNNSTTRINKRKELFLNETDQVVFTAAELIPRKNYEVALRSFKKIATENTYFVICGVGSEEKKLKHLVNKLHIDKNVKFLGFRKDLHELYRIADVFFFPSLQEGLSVALLGAMASGLPVICSNIRGNVDLIDDKMGGYLYNSNDEVGFSKGLSKLLGDVQLSQSMGNYNATTVKKFEIIKIINDFYSIVEGSLKNDEM